MCANPPSLFKGPYGPNPVVNSAVDGELVTSSDDGEFIREKARIVNALVTCAGLVSLEDARAPVGTIAANSNLSDYISADPAKYTGAAAGLAANADSALIALSAAAAAGEDRRFCLFQAGACRRAWNFVHHDYQSTLFWTPDFTACIDRCLPAVGAATIGAGQSVPATYPAASAMGWAETAPARARAAYTKCGTVASLAWDEMIRNRDGRTGATLLAAAAVIMAAVAFVC